jgi:hypothetical protein
VIRQTDTLLASPARTSNVGRRVALSDPHHLLVEIACSSVKAA